MALAAVHIPYLNRFRPLAYLLVLIAVWAFAYAEPNFPLFVVGTVAIALSWTVVETRRGKPLPRILVNLGVLAASMGLFYELVIAPESRDIRQANLLMALGHFMSGILLCKLFERKTNRDYAQILTLSLLIMVAGAIVATASLLFALLLALYLSMGLYAILLFHLRAEAERAVARDLVADGRAFAGNNNARIRKDIRYVAVWSGFLLMLIAAIVFLLIPRSPTHDFLSPWGGSNLSTGFSEQVQMRDFVSLHASDAVAMEVTLQQNETNIGSEGYQPYFRGAVLDTYSGRTWLRSSQDARETSIEYPTTGNTPVQFIPPEQYNMAGTITQTYSLHISRTSHLFAIAPPVSASSEQLHMIVYWPQEMLLSNPERVSHPLNYTVTSAVIMRPGFYKDSPFVTPGDLGTARSEMGMVRYNTVPEKIAELARSVAGNLLPPPGDQLPPDRVGAIATKFRDYLRTTYPYTMQFHVVNRDIDPTEDFLFNRKSVGGHCDCFASAMVMMCRAVGINARMAAGYHGGDFNSVGGYYVVKEKDAHSWVEVFTPDRGWTIFDPTPSAPETSKSSAIARWFREVSGVLQRAWLSTVVAFDNTSRKYIFNTVSNLIDSTGAWLKEKWAQLTSGLHELLFGESSPVAMRILGFASIAGILFLAGWLGRRWQRRRTSQIPMILKSVDRKVHRQLAHDLAFFDDLLRLLGRSGRRKQIEETPLEYVESCSAELGQAAGDARWLIATFYDIRFGAIRLNATMSERITEALHAVKVKLQG